MKTLGLYIHIPFCIKKCNYCDFYSLACQSDNTIDEYVNSLCKHIEHESALYENYIFDTVFIGGGTPSVLTEKQLEKIAKTIKKCLHVSEKAEFSVECNPCSITEKKLEGLLTCGVNRLSIGLQSSDDNSLKILGRLHTFDEFARKYELARTVGFNNINIDIMYATPKQKLTDFCKTLDTVCDFAPEHISAYCLKLESGTPFYTMKLDLPDEDIQYDMYMSLCDKLAHRGYEHYEISNFAKKGYMCRHNLKYWQMEEYIGFGASSHSFFNKVRYSYESNLQKYISDINSGIMPQKIAEETHIPRPNDIIDEYIMLKMRLLSGLLEKELYDKFSIALKDYSPNIEKYINSGHIVYKNGIYHFSDEGFFVSNYILTDILKLD